MQAGMPPQGADQAPEKSQASPSDIAEAVMSGMEQLMQLMQQAPSIPDQEKQELGMIMQAFKKLIGSEMGEKQKAPGQMGSAPMESAGNPNARPVI